MNYCSQGENIGGKTQPPDDSETYLNIASMTHVFREFKTVVSIDHTLQIPKNNILKCSFMGFTAEEEESGDQNSSEYYVNNLGICDFYVCVHLKMYQPQEQYEILRACHGLVCFPLLFYIGSSKNIHVPYWSNDCLLLDK